MVSTIGTSLGITTPIELLGLSECFGSGSSASVSGARFMGSSGGFESDSVLSLFGDSCSCWCRTARLSSLVLCLYPPHFLLVSARVELLLAAPPTGPTDTTGAGIAGGEPPAPAISGAGLHGAFLSKSLPFPSASTASMIICLHSLFRSLDVAPLDTTTRCCAVLRNVRFEHVKVTYCLSCKTSGLGSANAGASSACSSVQRALC